MITLLSGMLVAGYLVAGLFFLRFWTSTHDRLFAWFSAAFGVLAVQRLALSLTVERMEDQTIFYLLRLLAFVMIAFAIIDKNRR